MSISFDHTLKACGKTYVFSIGGAGCEKRVTRTPKVINKDPIQIFGFGQDSIGIMKTDTQLLLSLADGHGPKEEGRIISYKIHEYVLTYIALIQSDMIIMLRKDDFDGITKIICEIFKNVNKIILSDDPITSEFKTGGTTLTLLHKIIDPENGSLYSLSYNVGDSPYFKISLDGEIIQLTQEQNCDNISSIEKYHNHCLKLDFKPSPIILNRFNIFSHFKTPWMGTDTIKPYIIETIDGKCKVTANTEVMKKFYENAPQNLKDQAFYCGGTQSIRGKPDNIKALKEGLFPMENFGSTINGDLQNINSFGDKKSITDHNILCEPHISFNKIEKPHYDFVGSDGPIDCLTDDDITEMFEEKPLMDMKEFTGFVSKTIDTKAVNGGFRLHKRPAPFSSVPMWDDNSFWVVETKIEVEDLEEEVVDEDLETTIIKLEIEHKKLLELATKIKNEIDEVNKTIGTLG